MLRYSQDGEHTRYGKCDGVRGGIVMVWGRIVRVWGEIVTGSKDCEDVGSHCEDRCDRIKGL